MDFTVLILQFPVIFAILIHFPEPGYQIEFCPCYQDAFKMMVMDVLYVYVHRRSLLYETNRWSFFRLEVGLCWLPLLQFLSLLSFPSPNRASFSSMSYSLLYFTKLPCFSQFHRISSNFSTLQLLGLHKHLIREALLLCTIDLRIT